MEFIDLKSNEHVTITLHKWEGVYSIYYGGCIKETIIRGCVKYFHFGGWLDFNFNDLREKISRLVTDFPHHYFTINGGKSYKIPKIMHSLIVQKLDEHNKKVSKRNIEAMSLQPTH